jgi:hypothetical protein
MIETNGVNFTTLMCENPKCQKLYSGIYVINESNICPECRQKEKFELKKVDNLRKFSNIK